ncbi:secretory carrier-associated membrane protein 1 [Drosophila novamexicana]|uniref:secretory carrier-associated membrane protein 1 n=1 Tax=Drosophila novamexicana TaxID=47314 RepID=UPI0011E5AF90|nr:secretory carrier-associated membrane protein 1 [Drosophila novamexicana]XP_032296185.1 secretory carrier-associated membrane protein 1 [Drosophila virilis]
MSGNGFDENPFGEPNLDNPFADPAIQQATRMSTNVSLEDYNPFEEQAKPQLQINSTNTAAVVQPLSQNIPPRQPNLAGGAAPSTSIQITSEELQRRQEELDRKAAELDRREQQLQGNVPQLNNWPPLPDNFCVKPCFYQDFEVEIPPEFQKLVKHLYYIWMFYTLTLVANIIGGLILLFHAGKVSNLFLAIFYTVLFTPASYVCWFRPAYKAFRNDSSFNFMVFFFVYFFQTVYTVVQAVGPKQLGYCGFITAIDQFESSASGIIVGLLLLIIAFCFAITAGANVLMIMKIHTIYRSTGASMDKAKAEFTTEFLRNQHVQEATSSAVSSAVNSQFNNSRY